MPCQVLLGFLHVFFSWACKNNREVIINSLSMLELQTRHAEGIYTWNLTLTSFFSSVLTRFLFFSSIFNDERGFPNHFPRLYFYPSISAVCSSLYVCMISACQSYISITYLVMYCNRFFHQYDLLLMISFHPFYQQTQRHRGL